MRLRLAPRIACAGMMIMAVTLSSCGHKSSPTAPPPGAVDLTVASTSPASGATAVPVTSTFLVKFSAAVDPSTATPTSFTLFRGATQVPGRVTVSDSTVTFTPLVPLRTATVYTATVTTALKDQGGHALASDHAWSATTQAGQSLGGVIGSSSSLTLASSPYVLTSDLQIAYGATLTIEPGVVIDGRDFKINVFGNLAAVGTAILPIAFLDARILPGPNAPGQPYVITIQHALVGGGRVYDATGNAVYGSLVLRDSRLYDLQGYLYVWYPVADCYIERNVFVSCAGISGGTNGSVKVYVRNNVFYQQTGGYALENWAAYNTSETIVALNSFLSTDRVALSLPAGFTGAHITGTNNYWGTTSVPTIEAMIFDQNDDPTSNEILVYQPILTSPDAATPDPAPWIPPVP